LPGSALADRTNRTAAVGGGDRHLYPELIRRADLALADALDLRRMEGIELLERFTF
jgi:hypothetical protein